MNKHRTSLSEKAFVVLCVLIIVFGGSFLYYYHVLDGHSINRVLKFTNGTDPASLKVLKKEYRRNEMVEYTSSFCKTRDAVAVIQWTLANERLTFFTPSDPINIPVGCYPSPGETLTRDLQLVPSDAKYGTHYFVGVTIHTLPDGRTRTQNYRTETFEVIP